MNIDDAVIVKAHYDADPQKEWDRLAGGKYGKFEFRIAAHFMDKYIKPGDSVLDIGGGTGRYSIWLAQKGCDVALFDLSEQSIEFAEKKAKEYNVGLKTFAGDARYISANPKLAKKYDHVLVMGPLYHLINENDRIAVLKGAISHLKKGGTLFVSFISLIGGYVYMARECPELITLPAEQVPVNAFINGQSFGGDGFTRAFFAYPDYILPFMEQFPLKKLHFFAQEGISAPFAQHYAKLSQEAVEEWYRISLAVCEKPEFFSYAEHLMYIGEKLK
ncbi:MAG: methyltransferase domain-containing protein [Oscillospiraceae bacterium]|nr:methyltransferase domain-containing protein [Oscillospiraceae bacterium]